MRTILLLSFLTLSLWSCTISDKETHTTAPPHSEPIERQSFEAFWANLSTWIAQGDKQALTEHSTGQAKEAAIQNFEALYAATKTDFLRFDTTYTETLTAEKRRLSFTRFQGKEDTKGAVYRFVFERIEGNWRITHAKVNRSK